MTGVEEQHARSDELVLRETVALIDDLNELGDQILARVLRALASERAQVLGELEASLHRGGLRLR